MGEEVADRRTVVTGSGVAFTEKVNKLATNTPTLRGINP